MAAALRIPAISGNPRLELPDSPAISITGDLEWVIRLAMDNWNDSGVTILMKDGGGSDRSWQWGLSLTPFVRFFWSANGTRMELLDSPNNFASAGFVNGNFYWVKVTFAVASGAYSVYWALDQVSVPTSWTLLGAAGFGPTGIFDGTAPLALGSYVFNNPAPEKIKYFALRNGIGGPDVAIFDGALVNPTGPTTPATTAQTGGTWSLQGGAVWEVVPGGWSVGSVKIA